MKNLKKMQLDVNVNASKAEIWDLLFNKFGEVNLFNPEIIGSHYTKGVSGEVGCERQCDINSKTSVHERITAARGNDSFDVEVVQNDMPMMDKMIATWDLKDIGGGQTRVGATMSFSTKPAFMAALMKGMMSKMINRMVIGLKYHVETGNLVTKENIKSIVSEYKQLKGTKRFTSKVAFASA